MNGEFVEFAASFTSLQRVSHFGVAEIADGAIDFGEFVEFASFTPLP